MKKKKKEKFKDIVALFFNSFIYLFISALSLTQV